MSNGVIELNIGKTQDMLRFGPDLFYLDGVKYQEPDKNRGGLVFDQSKI